VIASLVDWPLTAADRLRVRWLHLLGGWARPIVRRRELRVALIFSTLIITALAGALVAPLWLLLLGPLVWGVPHLVADLRYLVVRTGYHARPHLWWLAGGPLLYIAFGGDLVWGFAGACAVALTARASLISRLAAVAVLAAAGLALFAVGRTADVVLAHVHNFLAVAFWWAWRPRTAKFHWIPLALLIAASLFILSPAALELARAGGGLSWFGAGMNADHQLWRLAPGVPHDLGLRLVLLFCFSQSLHYGVWLHLVPDEDRPRATPPTFRASYEHLRRDLGDVGLAVAALLAAGVAVWAAVDLTHAHHGYFRLARFHAHLEIMAGTLLLLERSRLQERLG
jgi:hypothetical protein